MIQLLKSWFKGLFTPRTKAQGLSNEPTYSQVERLIEAAGGASRQGGSLYSKPTYSQFERLIAALGGGSGSGSGSGLPAKRDKDDLATYAYPATPGYWTSGADRFDPVDGEFPNSNGVYIWAHGNNRIQYNPGNGNIFLAFAPTEIRTTSFTGLDPREPEADFGTLQLGSDGRTFSYTPAVRGEVLEKDGDSLARKSYVDTTFVEKGATNILIGSGASKVNNVTNAVVIGVNASANGSTTSSAVAIGTEAKAKKTGAVQLGAGENSEEKSLQFRGTKVVGGDGKIPETSLHYVPALESVPEQAIAASTSYAVGVVVVDSGKAYRCKSAYTSAATPESPSVDTEHWTEVPVLTGVTQLFAGRNLPQAPTQNEVAEAVKELFEALGGTISTTSANEDNP